MEKRVHLIQCLCPERHALMAFAFEATDRADVEHQKAELIQRFENLFKSGALNRLCGICGSTVLHYEVGRTRWSTIPEAMPHLRATEMANIASRSLLEEMGGTHDVKKNN